MLRIYFLLQWYGLSDEALQDALYDSMAMRAFAGVGLRQRLIHTGQHYDRSMSDTFFEELGIPQPDLILGLGGGSAIRQIADVMKGDTIQTPSSVEIVPKVTLIGSNACSAALPDVNCELHALKFGLV